MKIINVNIEELNMSGICVGCMNYDRRMFGGNKIKECFKLIADIDIPDGITIQVCWECIAHIDNVLKFRNTLEHSYNILYDYCIKNKFLDWPANICVHARQRLNVTGLAPIAVPYLQEAENIETSLNENCDLAPECDGATVKSDTQLLDIENATIKSEIDVYDEVFFIDNDIREAQSSEEDVKLSELKAEKIDRSKEKKKKLKKSKLAKHGKSKTTRAGRKLRNLPKTVKLITMGEELMREVRSTDSKAEEFVKMKYKCESCILIFNSEKIMLDHFNGKHREKGPQSHQCDVCQGSFLSKDNLSSHRALHLAAYKCRLCGYKTTLKRLMLLHIAVHSETKPYTCSVCLSSFSTRSKMAYHRSVCQQERPQCDCCGKVFANKATLRYHLRAGPQKKEDRVKEEEVEIPCKGCDKVFRSKKSYRAHVVIHNGLIYPCPVCGKLFQWKRNLSRHARAHRERAAGAVHECRECSRTFASRDCYNNHMKLSRRHAGDAATPHVCSYCDKKFATKWSLADHIDWDHFKVIKYECKICFKAFKTAKILSAHTNNIHEGKKAKEPDGEHLCEICGKSYKTVRRLKGHVWAMHLKRSSTKKYKCPQCPATFTWQTSIYKHMRMMHQTGKKKNPGTPKPVEQTREMASRMQYFHHYPTNNT